MRKYTSLSTGIYYWLYAPVYDRLGWKIDDAYNSYYRSEPTKEPKQDMERIKLIVNLYFPSLEEIIHEYDLSLDLVISHMSQFKGDSQEDHKINSVLIRFQKCHEQLQAQLIKLSGQRKAKIRHIPMPKPLQS